MESNHDLFGERLSPSLAMGGDEIEQELVDDVLTKPCVEILRRTL